MREFNEGHAGWLNCPTHNHGLPSMLDAMQQASSYFRRATPATNPNARKLPPCGRRECRVSTGIHDGVTAGIGGPDFNGFFDEPCAICEDYFSKLLNEMAAPTTAAEPATGSDPALPETAPRKGGYAVNPTPSDAGAERGQAVRPRTSTIRRLSRVVTQEIHEAFMQCHGNFYPCERWHGLRLCLRCGEEWDEVHFHNEAIV